MENDTTSYKIILGSSSAARRQILSDIGYKFTTMSADIDEKSIRFEKPEELVMALAEAKADAIISKLQTSDYQDKAAETTMLVAADMASAVPNQLAIDECLKDAEPTLLITCDQWKKLRDEEEWQKELASMKSLLRPA